jgi:methyl-accepting chemotaxis protein
MENVRLLVERSADSTLSLAETAQVIGGIVTTVSDVAEQTNILALNAAIEATRAGGQGTAFRIVAAEIKSLAGETKRLAGEVRQMILNLQKASGGLVIIAEQCTHGVSSAARVIASADESISALAQVIEDASQTAVQISASANQQATGTAQIHQAMEQIREVTVQNLSATRQMEQAAKDLTEMGARLRADLQQAEASSAYMH